MGYPSIRLYKIPKFFLELHFVLYIAWNNLFRRTIICQKL